MSNKNRDFGARVERTYRTKFIDLGFSFCKTTRQASRLLDDCKVDLMNLPINVQVKGGKSYDTMNASEILSEMSEALVQNYPPDHQYHKQLGVIIHHRRARGRRKDYDTLVYMTLDDFKHLAKPSEVVIHDDTRKKFNKIRRLKKIVESHTVRKPYIIRFNQSEQTMIMTSWRVFVYFFKRKYLTTK